MKYIIKRFFAPLLITLNILGTIGLQARSLADFDYKSASVLPFFYQRGHHKSTKWVILTREAYGKSKGLYDDCSGGRERNENNPLITAAREFWEEAILKDTVDASLHEVRNFIDINTANNTEVVVVYSRDDVDPRKNIGNVTYITNIHRYKKPLLNNFYPALKSAIDKYDAAPRGRKISHFSEKDRIAIVRWNDLKDAITNQTNRAEILRVKACVLDPVSQRRYIEKDIKLRPFLVTKLRSFFSEEPYETSESQKIRFYSD